MPWLNGYQFIKKLRNELTPPLSETPVIVISGHSDKEALDKVDKLGVDLFLLKPVTREQVVTRKNAAMRQKFADSRATVPKVPLIGDVPPNVEKCEIGIV